MYGVRFVSIYVYASTLHLCIVYSRPRPTVRVSGGSGARLQPVAPPPDRETDARRATDGLPGPDHRTREAVEDKQASPSVAGVGSAGDMAGEAV